jgi:hypothetical protein
MNRTCLLTLLTVVAVGLAGCANNSTTQTTSTPAASTTMTTSTMTMTTTTPTPSGNMTTPHCAASNSTGAATDELVYTVTEASGTNPCYQLHGPATASAGWVRVTLDNGGHEPHQVELVRLDNITFEEFVAEQAPGGSAHPMDLHNPDAMLITPSGGPQTGPGSSTTVTVELAPGEYAAICFVPGMMGIAHGSLGMVAPLTVAAGNDTGVVEPTADLTLSLKDYAFNWSENVTAGNHTIAVTNAGPHHHEAVLVKLVPGKTLDDFLAAFEPNATAPPPMLALTGASGIAAGMTEYLDAELTTGHWGLLCFETDSDQSPPHFVIGMKYEFDVA